MDNQILPKWRRQVADLILSAPKISVVPATDQEADIDAAKLAEKLAENFWLTRMRKSSLVQIGVWKYSTGSAFISDFWNEELGGTYYDEKTNSFRYRGDVDCRVSSPFEVIAPAIGGVTDVDDLDWFGFVQPVTLDALYRRFGNIAKKIAPEQLQGNQILWGLLNPFGTRTTAQQVDMVNLIEMRIKPCRDFPKGLFVLAANGTILQKMDFPYKEFSTEILRDVFIPGQFWGNATLTEAIPLQVDWNKDITSIRRYNDWLGKGRLRAPRRSNLEIQKADEGVEILYYTPVLGHKPEVFDPGRVATTFAQNLERLQFSMENLFSQHEVTRGTNRSDLRSGEMVAQLLEQDAIGGKTLSHTMFEEALERFMRRVLQRIQRAYKDERYVKLTKTDGANFELLRFRGADLRDNTDVKIGWQSSVPESRTLREIAIERRFERGHYGDPSDPRVRRRVGKMLEDAVSDAVHSGMKVDETQAEWENRLMMTGEKMVPNTYDNHLLHLEVHDEFRKSLTFQRLRMENFKVFQTLDNLFEEHCMMHRKVIMDSMRKEASDESTAGTK